MPTRRFDLFFALDLLMTNLGATSDHRAVVHRWSWSWSEAMDTLRLFATSERQRVLTKLGVAPTEAERILAELEEEDQEHVDRRREDFEERRDGDGSSVVVDRGKPR